MPAIDPPMVRLQDKYDALEEALDMGDMTRVRMLRAEIRHDLSYQAQIKRTAEALENCGVTAHVRAQFRDLGWNLVPFGN